MKRIATMAVPSALLCVGLGMGLTASAADATSGAATAVSSAAPVGAHLVGAPRAARGTQITNGSTWTYYDESEYPFPAACEILTFGTTTFSGDRGDSGKYKSSIRKSTIIFKGDDAYFNPKTFTGRWTNGTDSDTGAWSGAAKESGEGVTVAPEVVMSGSDPLDLGSC